MSSPTPVSPPSRDAGGSGFFGTVEPPPERELFASLDPSGGASGSPQAGASPDRPARPEPSGDQGLPQRGSAQLPRRDAQEPDSGRDPHDSPQFWPRRQPGRSLAEEHIESEHAEPTIPVAWKPPADLRPTTNEIDLGQVDTVPLNDHGPRAKTSEADASKVDASKVETEATEIEATPAEPDRPPVLEPDHIEPPASNGREADPVSPAPAPTPVVIDAEVVAATPVERRSGTGDWDEPAEPGRAWAAAAGKADKADKADKPASIWTETQRDTPEDLWGNPQAPPDEAPDESVPDSPFLPANDVERSLLEAVDAGSSDRFLSTLLLAKVLVPGWDGVEAVDPAAWGTDDLPGGRNLVVFTSLERLVERLGPETPGGWIKFTALIRVWPGANLGFAVNPDSRIGAVLPGGEVMALASWAAELGLGTEPEPEPAEAAEAPRPSFEPPSPNGPVMMQKPISPEQLSYYLERGYDRVSGFVHRAGEVAHLRTPNQLYQALGLGYAGSSFKPEADEAYVLRWLAFRANLYRIPYGGQHEAGMRAMEGWVIERPPFRGNGFAPSDTNDVIAEFKVDSVRLPHNAQLWRLRRDGREELLAMLDADGPRWRRVGEL